MMVRSENLVSRETALSVTTRLLILRLECFLAILNIITSVTIPVLNHCFRIELADFACHHKFVVALLFLEHFYPSLI
jgi:hypothetical protein